jgi:hypothetical protein
MQHNFADWELSCMLPDNFNELGIWICSDNRIRLSDNAVALVFSLLIVLQILSIGLPIRFMSSIQQLSPIANQQGRILSLLYFGSYNSREAFINDELTSYFRVRFEMCVILFF